MKKNPFTTGKRVPPNQFINRRKEVNSAVSLLLTGQSLAFVGDPRSGKTSLLLYLQDPEMQQELYDEDASRLVFFYLDSQPISDEFTCFQFWNQMLQVFISAVKKKTPKSQLMTLYKSCEKSKFNTFALEDFFKQSQKESWHLVLLLDEFETILHHPVLNSTEFYGGLRTLASRFGDAFTLVLSSQHTLSELNIETQIHARNGSPFFNYFKEIPILPFKKIHAQEVLNQSDRRFSSEENQYLLDLAGYHPYFLQISGSALWDAYESDYSPQERLIFTGQEVLRMASVNMERIWQHWAPNIRKAFTIIALDEMPTLLGKHNFNIENMRESLSLLTRELRYLCDRGFIAEDTQLPSGYCVTAKVILLWLAEELLIALQKNDDLGQLLYQNQWQGMFTNGEMKQFTSAISSFGLMARTGAETFIKAAAEGFGKGTSTK